MQPPPPGARGDEDTPTLETKTLAIVDVAAATDDVRAERKFGWTLFAVMFGATASHSRQAREVDPLAPLRAWVAEDASRGARVYRTVDGFRFLITAPPFDPASAESDALLERLGGDPDYRSFCRTQARYRAHLTPKVEPQTTEFSTCRFVESFGPAAEGEVAKLVERHDRATRAHENLALA